MAKKKESIDDFIEKEFKSVSAKIKPKEKFKSKVGRAAKSVGSFIAYYWTVAVMIAGAYMAISLYMAVDGVPMSIMIASALIGANSLFWLLGRPHTR